MRKPYLILCVLIFAGSAYGQSLQPGDFARGIRLVPAGDEPFQFLPLPKEVYQTVRRNDLGDLRVFNGAGEEIPFAIWKDTSIIRTSLEPVPHFPITESSAGSGVQVRITDTGALVQLADRVATSRVGAYLIDASALQAPVRQLHFEWADTASFISEVSVSGSDNLLDWEPLAGPTTVAHLRYGQSTLSRDEIALTAQAEKRYLRLTWSADGDPLPVARVHVETGMPGEPPQNWEPVNPISHADGVYLFDAGGRFPAEHVRFSLPQNNTLVRVRVESADDPHGPWTHQATGIVYRLSPGGKPLTAPPFEVGRTTDRYWRLTIPVEGGGIGSGNPVLELGWTPDVLVFLPRGNGPYLLAFGSGQIGPTGAEGAEALRLFRNRISGGNAVAATAGDRVLLGGPDRLERRPITWARLLLWGALGMGALMLIGMATVLLRNIQKIPEEKKP